MRTRLATILAALALTALITGCSDDDGGTPTDTTVAESTDTTRPEPQSSVVEVTPAPIATDVDTASSPLGEILVDADGMTLYFLLTDTAGATTCVDSCAQAWPPLVVTSVSVATSLNASDFSLVARPDGTQQLAMGGRPLYRFAGDTKAGDTTGQGLNSVWYVAGANGQPVDDSATGD
jgi:predicted lipoprotein with Yx(FWY)xxD motif